LQISIFGAVAVHPFHVELDPSQVSMPVHVPYMFVLPHVCVIPSRMLLQGQEAPESGTHQRLGAVGRGPPLPVPLLLLLPPMPPPPMPPPSAPASELSYSPAAVHVKPLGHIPSTVQSRAQKLSPGGAVRHASEGILQSLAIVHFSHSCPTSGMQMALPLMIEQ
jgi:hypothetical protein